MDEKYQYLVLQIRTLLNNHLFIKSNENNLWRIQSLIEDELEAKANLITNK
jgi:hypothetical protein